MPLPETLTIDTDSMSTDEASPAEAARVRSRRAVISGAIGGVLGLLAGRLGRPEAAAAASGDPLRIGTSNLGGTSSTQLTTAAASGTAFLLKNTAQGKGLTGWSSAAVGSNAGVYGRADAPNADGVLAQNFGAAGNGAAMRAIGNANDGVHATSADLAGNALRAHHAYASDNGFSRGTTIVATGYSADPAEPHVGAFPPAILGVGGNGIIGIGDSTFSDSYGVIGVANTAAGIGVVAENSASGTALYAFGDSTADGDLSVSGVLTKGSGAFKIDHPLDPARKFLYHSFVESPDMMNVYNGNVRLDAKGEATVQLPSWFGALNRDFRYQLTAIGRAAPGLYVKSGVKANAFVISGGEASAEVSWQVTGIRQDAWANAHRIPVEVAKSAAEAGKYLHAAEHGKSDSESLRGTKRAAQGRA